ncbi:MAG: hypothetical protein IMZ44_03425 [Planctomycetes bacterium]|nr:hypothetical protein [Planctomycetota bacterium]
MTRDWIARTFCPEPGRRPSHGRLWNIALRTVHIAVTGTLIGGHAFDVPADRLRPILWAVIASGAGLAALDSYKSLDWVHQGWGVMLLLKLGLLCLVPVFWDVRLPLLLAVVILASVESHMPARFRHYSFLYRRVMKA